MDAAEAARTTRKTGRRSGAMCTLWCKRLAALPAGLSTIDVQPRPWRRRDGGVEDRDRVRAAEGDDHPHVLRIAEPVKGQRGRKQERRAGDLQEGEAGAGGPAEGGAALDRLLGRLELEEKPTTEADLLPQTGIGRRPPREAGPAPRQRPGPGARRKDGEGDVALQALGRVGEAGRVPPHAQGAAAL